MPRNREELFSPPPVLAGAFIIIYRVKSDRLMVELPCDSPRLPKVGPEPYPNSLPTVEVSGLSKIEAEDLLDLLEAAGYDLCELSFIDGEGFSVRPTSPPAPESHSLRST